MTNPVPLNQRFADCVNALWRVVAGHQGGGALPQRMDPLVINLVYYRLRAIARRFAAICARAAAGTLRPPPIRTPRTLPSPESTPPKPRKPALAFPHRLPGIPGWLRAVSNPRYHTNIAAGGFERLFAEADLRDLVAQAPQLRRILRPLCTMLGIELPTPTPDPEQPPPTPKKPRARPIWRVDPARPEYPGAIVPPLRFKIA